MDKKYQCLIIVNINQSLSDDLEKTLVEELSLFYTKIEGTKGRGSSSEPHLGTPIWPEFNDTYLIGISEEKRILLLDYLKKLKNDWPNAGINWFVLSLTGCS